jgi:ABC-2 type transport system permease protein
MNERLSRFLRRVAAIAGKEALHIRRDPRTLYLALAMPVVMLALFGYGVSFDLDEIPVAIVDLDGTAASRQLARDLVATGDLVLAKTPADVAGAEALLRRAAVLGAVVIPHDFGRALARGEPAELQLLVDGADAVAGNSLLAKAEPLARASGARLAVRRLAPPRLTTAVWTRFNPTVRSALFLVPGLSAYLLALAAVLLTALTVAGEWERGSMEQLFAAPVGRLEIVLGKLLPYLGLGVLQLLLVLALGAWMFDVPMRGPLPLVFAMGLLFLVGMLGQGLLISVVTKNQLVATQAGALSSMLPSLLLSGFLFPIENMPVVLQWLSVVVPARYFVHGLRGVLLKGNGLAELWPDLAALALFAVAIVAVSTARFQRRLA